MTVTCGPSLCDLNDADHQNSSTAQYLDFETPASHANFATIDIEVPASVPPGQSMRICPSESDPRIFSVVVPPGIAIGQKFIVQVPAAGAASGQMRLEAPIALAVELTGPVGEMPIAQPVAAQTQPCEATASAAGYTVKESQNFRCNWDGKWVPTKGGTTKNPTSSSLWKRMAVRRQQPKVDSSLLLDGC